jgi:sec-independent protein translocase protein TatA
MYREGMGRIGGGEILLLALIVLLLFGAARLPKLARSMREARDEFQKGTEEGQHGAPASEASAESSESSTPGPAPTAEKPQENT